MKILYDKITNRFLSIVRDDIYIDDSVGVLITNDDMSWLTSSHFYQDGFWRYQIDKTVEESLANGFRLVRRERDKLLSASDWTQLPDVPLATKEKWAVYRQALRDITQQSDPFNIVWPEPPQ